MIDRDILQYAIQSGIVDIHTIKAKIEMNERKRYVEQHENKIWQSADGKWYTYLPDKTSKRGKKLVKKSTYESLENAIVEFYKEVVSDPVIKDVFDLWVIQKIEYKEVEPQTIDRYRTDFSRYISTSALSEVRFRFITEDMLERFIRETIAKNNMSSKAWNNLRVLINGIFNYGYKNHLTDIKISVFMGELKLSKNLFSHKYKKDNEKVFADDEVNTIIDYINEYEFDNVLALGVYVAFYTGIRIGELSALTWDDIDFKNHFISVTKTEVRYRGADGKYVFEIRNSPKTDCGNRDIAMTDDVENVIKRLKLKRDMNCEYVFSKNGTWINNRLFTQKLYRICDKLNLKRRSMHKARMTYATKLIDGGVPDSVIIRQMGHTDIETTRKYYYHSNKSKQQVLEAVRKSVNY